jgi:SAM-dependent methyltransferase
LNTGAFKDHFSGHAGSYTRYRPAYPEGLFRCLAALTEEHASAWDCATGNGQAALGLTPWYARVEATDASAQQIAEAAPHPNVRYSVASAEASGLPDASADLITVAQALHWFDFERFYAEARRVAKPHAVLAAWSYELCQVTPEVDRVMEHLYASKLESYWPPERRHVENAYRDIPFPFTEISLPAFRMQAGWTLEHFLGYIRTWSAVRAYIGKNGRDPVEEMEADLTKAWGDATTAREIVWPLNTLAGWID